MYIYLVLCLPQLIQLQKEILKYTEQRGTNINIRTVTKLSDVAHVMYILYYYACHKASLSELLK